MLFVIMLRSGYKVRIGKLAMVCYDAGKIGFSKFPVPTQRRASGFPNRGRGSQEKRWGGVAASMMLPAGRAGVGHS